MPGGFRVQTGKMTVNDLSQQVRHILRKLVRAPLFTITTVGTLAPRIGANAAIFTIVNGVLLKPLPFEDPDELVGLWHVAPGPRLRRVPSGEHGARDVLHIPR